MRDALEQRRTELAAELESGQRMLADLDARRTEVQQTLLRISGALQVLSELLDGDEAQAGAAQGLTPVPDTAQAG